MGEVQAMDQRLTLLSGSTKVKVGLSGQLLVNIATADAARSERGWSAKVVNGDDHVLIELRHGGPSTGSAHPTQKDVTVLGWLREGCCAPQVEDRWSMVQAQVVENNRERVLLRVPRSQMRPPIVRTRRKKPAEGLPPVKSCADARSIKELVQAINRHVETDDGLSLSVDPRTGKLRAAIMVEYE